MRSYFETLARTILQATLAAAVCAVVTGCSDGSSWFTGDIWTESAIGVIGGTLTTTEGIGSVARHDVPSDRILRFFKSLVTPIEAIADGGQCPAVTSGTCVDLDPAVDGAETLQLFYNGCQSNSTQDSAYWRTYILLKFPNGTKCSSAQASGFSTSVIASLVDSNPVFASRTNILKRSFGINAGGDQYNFRVSANGTIVQMVSDFPSGWKDDLDNLNISDPAQQIKTLGGIEVTFPSTTRRELRIKGLHFIARLDNDKSVTKAPIDWTVLFQHLTDESNYTTSWDQTMNTYRLGDKYTIRLDDGSDSTVTETQDQDIVVVGSGAGRQVIAGAVRLQFNISNALARMAIKDPLVYGDATCCYPTQGTAHTDYDPTYKMKWNWEEITFNSTCGDAVYRIHDSDSGATQEQTVQLAQCH